MRLATAWLAMAATVTIASSIDVSEVDTFGKMLEKLCDDELEFTRVEQMFSNSSVTYIPHIIDGKCLLIV